MSRVDVVEVETTGDIIVVGASAPEVIEVGVPGPPGLPGPPGGGGGGSTTVTGTAGVDLSGHRAVVPDSGAFIYADSATLAHASRTPLLTTGAASEGADVTLLLVGELTEPSWDWTPDAPVFLGNGGSLSQTEPVQPTDVFSLQLGTALTATSILFEPRQPIALV